MIIEIMRECYNFGERLVDFDIVTYTCYVYVLELKCNSNGMITITIMDRVGHLIVTHIYENMTDFRQAIS